MYIDVHAGSHKAKQAKRSRSKKKLQRPCGARCSATHALPEFQPACDSPGTSRSPDSPVALVLQVDRRSGNMYISLGQVFVCLDQNFWGSQKLAGCHCGTFYTSHPFNILVTWSKLPGNHQNSCCFRGRRRPSSFRSPLFAAARDPALVAPDSSILRGLVPRQSHSMYIYIYTHIICILYTVYSIYYIMAEITAVEFLPTIRALPKQSIFEL